MSYAWAAPELGQVIGAAHRRQERPCQDAVLSTPLHDQAGELLQLMAVADGHGGSRYWLSEVGSRLACEQAAAAIADQISQRALDDPGWELWLGEELPALVQNRWLQAIEADWLQRQPDDDTPFSPLTYGTTLGLVLMTRRWWAAGGLGDWDLLEVPADGPARLLNQEPDLGGSTEATGSLCLPEAVALWQQRCQLVRLDPEQGPLTLLLSSDGLRKSCATDDDYQILGAYLCGLSPDRSIDGTASDSEPSKAGSQEGRDSEPVDLEAALARITNEGSGDDVSVAIGRWRRAPDSPAPAAGATASQPPQDLGVVAAAANREERVSGRVSGRTILGLLLLLGIGGGLLALVLGLVRRDPPPEITRALTDDAPPAFEASDRTALVTTIATLCSADAATRRATLRNRRSQFESLRTGAVATSTLMVQASEDPIGALIAWSRPTGPEPATGPVPGPGRAATPEKTSGPVPRSEVAAPIGWPRPCPELEQELRAQWRAIITSGAAGAPRTVHPAPATAVP